MTSDNQERQERAALNLAPTVEECLRAARANLHPWQVQAARHAFKLWLASWDGLKMTAEDLQDRV